MNNDLPTDTATVQSESNAASNESIEAHDESHDVPSDLAVTEPVTDDGSAIPPSPRRDSSVSKQPRTQRVRSKETGEIVEIQVRTIDPKTESKHARK